MKTCTSKGHHTKRINANPKAYDHQPPKHQILIILLCVCYAIGAQTVKTKVIEKKLIITRDFSTNCIKIKHEIEGFSCISPWSLSLPNCAEAISFFLGEIVSSDSEDTNQYIFIPLDKRTRKNTTTLIKVAGYKFRTIDKKQEPPPQINKHMDGTIFAHHKISKQEESFIFSAQDEFGTHLYFYYRRGKEKNEVITVERIGSDGIFYQAIAPIPASTKAKRGTQVSPNQKTKIWEIEPLDEDSSYIPKIVTSWEINKEDIGTLHNNPSSNWLIFRTLKPNSSWLPYFKPYPYPLFGILAFLALCYPIFYKEINKKIIRWWDHYMHDRSNLN